MELKVIATELKDVYILEPEVRGDERGYFCETWNEETMKAHGLDYTWVQDNESYNVEAGTLRGMHYQKGAASQAKLVRCISGEVLDVAIDMRKSSPTFGKWTSVVLSSEKKNQFLIPRGFAHGYMTLTKDALFAYKVDNIYTPGSEGFLRWNDPEIGINWGETNPVILERDAKAPLFSELGEDYFE